MEFIEWMWNNGLV